MKRLGLIAAMASAVTIAGCSKSGMDGFLSFPRDKIQIVNGDTPRKYRVVKALSVDLKKGPPQYGGYRGPSDIDVAFKEEALSLGADAVIKVTYHDVPMSFFDWGSISGTGVAVKFVS
jgi:hypothetical protein